MSAFEVNNTHIDALVTAALVWSAPHLHYGEIFWFDQDPSERPDDTHQAGSPWGPGALNWYNKHKRTVTRQTAGMVGAMLLAENRRSVDFRYGEEKIEAPYLFHELPGNPHPLVILRALSCYEYQSCETPDWERSEAKRFCDALRSRAISILTSNVDVYEITNRNVFVDYARGQYAKKII